MLTLVRRARRRLLRNDLLSQGANAISVALTAFILLLLAGTQVLNWRWLVLLPLAAAGAGLYLVFRRLPSPYGVAQIVDRRLRLADTLSTALFFSQSHAAAKVSEDVRRLQYERAERLSKSVDVRAAVPYTLPRAVYLLAGLILVASSLFALRYGVSRRLDLKPPLASILQQAWGFPDQVKQARAARKALPPEAGPSGDENGDVATEREQNASDRQDEPSGTPEESNETRAANGDVKKLSVDARKPGEDGEKADAEESDGTGDERAGGDGDNAGNQPGNAQSKQKQDSGAKQDANSGENSSLMSKFKDALQNLISRMKPPPGQQGAQQQTAMDQRGKEGKGQQGSKASKDGQQQSGGQQSDAQEGEAGDQAQNSQDPQGKGAGKSDTPQASKQPGSGIGSEDGDKNLKQAEQLAAMGKIAEILGKRSATVTGESTVEVQSTSQQLHTPYAQRGVQHSQGGAEINRDEVPVALQAYVEQYFEQVRKQPVPARK